MGLGLAEPGFASACYVEWEKYPRSTLIAGQRAGYLHTAPIWDNVKTFNARPWRGIIDTLLAGYPCQPFSQAGQRKGESDPRHLWPDIERVIDELGPDLRWCLFENVSGHLTLGLETVVRALQRLGFRVAVGLFSAEETGAPHERQRVFIVAYRARIGAGKPDDEIRAVTRENARRGPGGRSRGLHGELVNPGSDADARGLDGSADRGSAGARESKGSERERLRDRTGRAGRHVDDATGARRDNAGIGATSDVEGGECLSGAGRDTLENTGHSERRAVVAAGNDTDRTDAGRSQADGRSGKSGDDVGNAEGIGRREGWSEHELWSGRDTAAGSSGELANGDDARSQGQRAWQRDPEGWEEQARHARLRSGTRLHPPGPSDMDAWRDVLALYPDGAPALSLGDISTFSRYFASLVEAGELSQAEAEHRLRRMADGLASRPRALRLLGNGVHPLAAAYAWRSLSAAHGLGRVDMGAPDRDDRARAAGAV